MKTVLIPRTNRSRELVRVRRALEKLHSLRLQMMLIVALTGATGFITSALLVSGGLYSMALRYPLAVGAAYLAFLGFLWCWLRLRWDDFLGGPDFGGHSSGGGSSVSSSAGDVPLPWEGGAGGNFGGGGASGSFDLDGGGAIASLDNSGLTSDLADSGGVPDVVADAADAAGSAFDLEELTVVIIAIAALAAAVFAAVWIVWIAPTLFAELTLDAALATGLYRRLKGVSGEYWLSTAIRRTIWPFVGVALLFTLAGFVMQAYAPEAKSIGHVIKHMKAH